MRFQYAAVLAALLAACAAMPAHASERLSLDGAMRRAVAADPSIDAARARFDAAEGSLRQSDTSPNPSLGLDVENFGGSGPYDGFDDAETTLSYQQPIELGGKRDARIALATRERDAASARSLVAALDLLEAVQAAYAEALAAEAEVGLADERLKAARAFEAELAKRTEAARDPEFALARATAQSAEAGLALEQARLVAEAARSRLATYWRGGADFRLDQRNFASLAMPVRSGREDLADTAVLEAERLAAAARVDVERSKAVRDPTVRLGVRHFSRNDDVAVVVGGSIPLGIFDDNSGAIDSAAALQRAAELDLQTYRQARDREIARLHDLLRLAVAEAGEIERKVLPAAERAVALAREGFSRGAFSYLDIAGAQNGLADAKERRIAALRRFHTTKAALDRLLGTHIPLVSEARP